MARHRRRHVPRAGMALAIFVSALLSASAYADNSPTGTAAVLGTNIFNPATAPVIKVKVTGKRKATTPRPSSTTISQASIEQKPQNTTISQIVISSVAGAAAAPNGDIHIRGSHGQYTYYLDDAPLPSNVSGSFSDLINPKSIQTLRIYTGGFPAQYGGDMAAIFDVTAKGGSSGAPSGQIQQLVQSYDTYQTNAQVGGSEGKLSYYISAIKDNSNFRLSPPSEDNFFNHGSDDVGFGKFDLQNDANNLFTLDVGDSGADYDIPNTPAEEQAGVHDTQKETGSFANLIWNHTAGQSKLTTVIYSHQSTLRFFGSPADLTINPGDGTPAVETNENQSVNYVGFRTDYKIPSPKDNSIMMGLDYDSVSGNQNFVLDYSVINPQTQNPYGTVTSSESDVGAIKGADQGQYLQDDITVGRTFIDTGVRYDEHIADIVSYQLSPRFNYYYTASKKDKFHAFYDHLFQPAAFEDVKELVGNASAGTAGNQLEPFEPEKDNFYEGGWQHTIGSNSYGFSAYYRDEKDTVDDSPVGNTQLTVPVNFTKGYTRGLEWTVDGSWSPTVSFYANYARSWAYESYPVSGGLLNDPTPGGYIPDDHDQTDTASFGTAYNRKDTFFTFDGEYGSGFPYNPGSDVFQYNWTHPHLTLDTSYGFKMTHALSVAFDVSNILNHAYIIKQAGEFSDTEWAEGRAFGVRLTDKF